MSKKKKPYTVGYGKTPQHTKFKPGKSGNPKGRPKKKLAEAEPQDLCDNFVSELQTKIIVTENGTRMEITKQEAISKQVVNKALAGDNKAIALLMHPNLRSAIEQRIANIKSAIIDTDENEDLSKLTAEELTERYMQAIGVSKRGPRKK